MAENRCRTGPAAPERVAATRRVSRQRREIRCVNMSRPPTGDGGEDTALAGDRLNGFVEGVLFRAWWRRKKPAGQGSHPFGAKRSGAAATCGLTDVSVRRLGW